MGEPDKTYYSIATNMENKQELWMDGLLDTKIGPVQKIRTDLDFYDYIGSISARLGINRMNYRINPGIYAIGSPGENSPVLVTANYKLTFDCLRKELSGVDSWLLILDTKGINVWCAAGKGTFGTKELIQRIISVKLFNLVNHCYIVLPQLGAVGVEAHKVTRYTNFIPKYGPVYACDIKEFLANGMKKSDRMKDVEFRLKDRIALIPIEVVSALVYLPVLYILALIINVINHRGFSPSDFVTALTLPGAVIASAVLFPILLPYLPSRFFSLKGSALGLIYTIVLSLISTSHIGEIISSFLVLTPIVSFTSLNFTGATPFTSQSGVMRETRISLPVNISLFTAGIIFSIINGIFRFLT